MSEIEKNKIRFVIVTDDAERARSHIPGVEVVGAAISDEPGGPDYKIGWYQMKGGPLSIDYGISKDEKPSGGKIHIRIVNSTL